MIKIGRMFHVIHMANRAQPLKDWYDDVFSPKWRGQGQVGYSAVEKRDALLGDISDLCIEPMAPSYRVEGAETMPVGRFHGRFGSHLHSIAWYVTDDLPELYETLRSHNVRLFTDGGGVAESPDKLVAALFTHPRDTATQWELMPVRRAGGPQVAMPNQPTAFWRD